uniref:Uncharacterized protein n=1 Tax=Lotus japonicus TaxID=34305 RepID=I3SX26_LOTJA|nr:unknown [Lotus japonicus]
MNTISITSKGLIYTIIYKQRYSIGTAYFNAYFGSINKVPCLSILFP